jgi:subtilisin family serine protease
MKRIFVLALLACTNGALAQSAVEHYDGHDVAAHTVLVKFKPTVRDPVLQSLRQIQDIDDDQGVGGIDVRKWHSRSWNATQLVGQLSSDPEVEYVEPDYIVHTVGVPNDPQFGLLWGLRNTGQTIQGVPGTAGADISAVPAWDISVGSRANVIAVVDTGIDYTHPDRSANAWSAPTAFSVTIGGVQYQCAMGTHGFNAITKTCDPMDDASPSHGTHVSGTIAGVGNKFDWRSRRQLDRVDSRRQVPQFIGLGHEFGCHQCD